jgi:hypothetical protein
MPLAGAANRGWTEWQVWDKNQEGGNHNDVHCQLSIKSSGWSRRFIKDMLIDQQVES